MGKCIQRCIYNYIEANVYILNLQLEKYESQK